MKGLVDFGALNELAVKYGFTAIETNPLFTYENGSYPWAIQAVNTDGIMCNWLYLNEWGDICIIGNTDNCNLWFHETRPDLTPERIVEFVKNLSCLTGLRLNLCEFVDPEDWQEIANVPDASEDERYKK